MTYSIFEISMLIYPIVLAFTLDEYICDNYRIERPFPWCCFSSENRRTVPSRPRPNQNAAPTEYIPRPFLAIIIEAIGMAFICTVFLMMLYALLTSPLFYVNLMLLFFILAVSR